MITSIFERTKFNLMAGSMVASSLILGACFSSGGGGDDDVAGIGGTGIVYGRIDNFGSVYVNDDRYNIDTSQIIVDGVGGQTQNDLRLGMIVQLEVETENGMFSDQAIEVVYDDEVEGPFNAPPAPDPGDPTVKVGIIFGQTINFSDTSTLYENTSFDDLGLEDNVGNMDVVEVSGYRVSDTEINATYVRFEGDLVPGTTEVELRGTIQNLMGTAPNETFEVDGTTVDTNGATVIDTPGGVLADNLYVEVEGFFEVGGSVTANEIEFEDEDFGDDVDDISIEGVIAGFTDINSDFFIDSQRVNASTATLSPPGLVLENGLNVEVEGEIVGGTLFADEVESEDEDSEMRGFVNNVTGSTFQVTYPDIPAAVTVRVDGNTTFEDDAGGPISTLPFSLDDLQNGNLDFVRVEGIEEAGDVVLATFVRRRASPDSEYKLEGKVDQFVLNSFIRVLGVSYPVDVATTYDPMQPIVGDFVEIEDDRVSNVPNAPGIADEVEIED